MQMLELKEESNKSEMKNSFWKRQFQKEATREQKIFDGVFGIILPTACFLFDPMVFRCIMTGDSALLLGEFKPFAYLLSYISIMALLAFMLWGEKLKWFNGFLSGLFAFAALISTIIGLILFPFSFIGRIILIGSLGFTPLFTGFVFWRNAVRSFNTAKPLLGSKLLVNMIVLSAILSFTIPQILNVKVREGMETIKTGDVQNIRSTTQKLQLFAPLIDPLPVLKAYRREKTDLERKEALAEAYQRLSGRDVRQLAK